jgi:hypothetical protein
MRFLSSAALALLLGVGCVRTIIPVIPSASQPSYDGTNQNSGFVGFDASRNGILSAHARDRYNSLVADYGALIKPPVKPGEGLAGPTSTNTWLIDPQHLVYFATFSRWHREGRPRAAP